MRTRYKIGQIIAITIVILFFLFISIKIEKPIFRWLFIALDGFMLYRILLYYNKCPVFIFNDENIISKSFFKTKIYYWKELNEVYLSIKETGVLLSASKYEATTLKFTNDDKIVLWNDTYINLSQIRKFIYEKAEGKIKDSLPEIKRLTIQSLENKVYRGNPFTNLNTILITGSFIYAFFYIPNEIFRNPLVLLVFVLPLTLLIGSGFQMNYFIIDNDQFIIKNHYFPWKIKAFLLADIWEMDIETPNKRSTSLRILTKDFQSKLYGAGSLRQRHWDELKRDLTAIGIPIRKD